MLKLSIQTPHLLCFYARLFFKKFSSMLFKYSVPEPPGILKLSAMTTSSFKSSSSIIAASASSSTNINTSLHLYQPVQPMALCRKLHSIPAGNYVNLNNPFKNRVVFTLNFTYNFNMYIIWHVYNMHF